MARSVIDFVWYGGLTVLAVALLVAGFAGWRI